MKLTVRRLMKLVTCAAVTTLGVPVATRAQDLAMNVADRGPRFFVNASPAPIPIDASRSGILRQRISVNFKRTKLRDALETISRQSGLRLMYTWAAVPVDREVTLKADGISVAGALSEVLLDAGVDVLFERDGQAAIVKRGIGAPRLAVGTVTGRVIDSLTRQGVAGATIAVDHARISTVSDAEGSYTLRGVTAGTQSVTARKLGYRTRTESVAVTEDGAVNLNFSLVRAPTTLSEVVVTPTGEQRRLELGHVVGVINADSVVREAPVASVSELLTSRVPGLQVFQTQGTVGGRVNLQLRGPTSFSVSNEPIVVIDGVRYTTAERKDPMCCIFPGSVEPSSPLNDLNPNDIESIEVVKGPSAATLYGTDAVNGVIVITTKRGRPGPAGWNFYSKASTTEVPTQRMPDIYWGWGTVDGVPNNPNVSCNLERLASGECTQQDSVTALRNPLKDPQYSILASKPTWEHGVNTSGGDQNLRYYFSGNFTDATGPLQMPPAVAEALKVANGFSQLPKEWREPNTLKNLNLRSNVSAVLGRTLDLSLSTAYIRSSTRGLTIAGDPYLQAMARAKPSQPTQPYGLFGRGPEEVFAQQSTDNVDRFVGSASGEWRALSWLSTHATLGLDVLGSSHSSLLRPGDQPNNFADGFVEDARARQAATTAELGASAKAGLGRVSSRTGVGAQYTKTLYDASSSWGEGLAQGQSVVPGALYVGSTAQYREAVVLGGYVEEMLGLNDRFFLTGALRADGASAFGRDFQAAVYPKLGASWLVSQEPFVPKISGLDELRVRFAMGSSGRQPDPSWARPSFNIRTGTIGGTTQSAYTNLTLGNPNLRPERTIEHEFGFDVTGLDARVTLEFTRFGRRTTDQLITVPSPPGFGSLYQNLGLTTQSGDEAKINARVLNSHAISLDVGLQHSSYATNLVSLGSGVSLVPAGQLPYGGYKVGYPLGARFSQPIIGWSDANGDGILDFNELVYSDTLVYMGQSFPPRVQTISTALGLLDHRIRISALLDRKTGFTQIDPFACWRDVCRALVDRNTSLEAQARALQLADQGGQDSPQKADFVRLREVSVAIDLPQRVTRIAGLSRGTLVASGRNLGLWSKFTGPDPEVTSANTADLGARGIYQGGAAGGIALGRAFSLRLDLGF